MQTFLPWPDAAASARALDDARLRKQGVECLQIVNTLLGKSYGYQYHPAVKMWAGHVGALGWYTTEIGRECMRRGFACPWDNRVFTMPYRANKLLPLQHPWWWGNERFHLAHQSSLIRKVPQRYGSMFSEAPLDAPYLWPTQDRGFYISKPDLKRLDEGERTWPVAWEPLSR